MKKNVITMFPYSRNGNTNRRGIEDDTVNFKVYIKVIGGI